jgi:NADPH:quinone reductase-like Zn-dependent oxidoreductase
VPERREIRCLGIEAPGRAFIWTYLEEPLAEGQFQIETLYSGLSAGTELTFFKGTNPYLRAGWNDRLAVFDEAAPAAEYPIRFLGYMEVGRVVESRTTAVSAGELVAMTYGHKTGHIADAAGEPFVVLSDDLNPLLGIYVAQMGPICANGLLHAAADARAGTQLALGDGVRDRYVVVTGAGVVGLLTGLWARQLGAELVAVADATPSRLTAVDALGLVPVDDGGGTAWRLIKERWQHGSDDCGADVAFQCQGQTRALVSALRALRPHGTVIDLAFYQGGAAELRLGEEFHHNGLSIRAAQISRVPRGLSHSWDRVRLAGETVAFLQGCGELILEHIVTDLVRFDDAPAFLAQLASRERASIQAVFEVAP